MSEISKYKMIKMKGLPEKSARPAEDFEGQKKNEHVLN